MSEERNCHNCACLSRIMMTNLTFLYWCKGTGETALTTKQLQSELTERNCELLNFIAKVE